MQKALSFCFFFFPTETYLEVYDGPNLLAFNWYLTEGFKGISNGGDSMSKGVLRKSMCPGGTMDSLGLEQKGQTGHPGGQTGKVDSV